MAAGIFLAAPGLIADGSAVGGQPSGRPFGARCCPLHAQPRASTGATVRASLRDALGKRRDAGTLKEGNGTLKLYDDDGTLRETVRYQQGIQQ